MQLSIEPLEGPGAAERGVEVVERKGLGHPDTICDALAEELSLALSRAYLERFGRILHHNVDKVLLRGGGSRPAFGVRGEILAPIELYLSGRATTEAGGVTIPVEEIAAESTRRWLGANLPHLDPVRDVRLHTLVRPGAADLTELFARGRVPLANDSSIGVGYAPLDALEHLVLEVETTMQDPSWKALHPACGTDVKVLGLRRGHEFRLTVACAMVGERLADLAAYRLAKHDAAVAIREMAAARVGDEVEAVVNAADDEAKGSVYLTVTGTSAEAGDDGEAGRGNRANGLITPSRPMTMESLAGKNPVTHVGKLYNLLAFLIAGDLVRELPHVREAECLLASRIGQPIDDPALLHLRLRLDSTTLGLVRDDAESIARARLSTIADLQRRLLDRTLAFDRWPLERGLAATQDAPR